MIRICTKCNIEKEILNFPKQKTGKLGFRASCKACETVYHKQYRRNNNEYIALQTKLYNKEYYKNHPNYKKDYSRKYRKNSTNVRLRDALRTRIRIALKTGDKIGSSITDLGSSVEDLKWWLEFWFDYGMTWDNYGNKDGQWSIDHIKPLSKFDLTNKKQFSEACNYKNLQPMWHIDNIRKGNKI